MTDDQKPIGRLVDEIRERIDEVGYGIFLLVILAIGWLVMDSYDWPMGIFCSLLMVVILELAYRLYSRG